MAEPAVQRATGARTAAPLVLTLVLAMPVCASGAPLARAAVVAPSVPVPPGASFPPGRFVVRGVPLFRARVACAGIPGRPRLVATSHGTAMPGRVILGSATREVVGDSHGRAVARLLEALGQRRATRGVGPNVMRSRLLTRRSKSCTEPARSRAQKSS